jgi:hypothetical protein
VGKKYLLKGDLAFFWSQLTMDNGVSSEVCVKDAVGQSVLMEVFFLAQHMAVL